MFPIKIEVGSAQRSIYVPDDPDARDVKVRLIVAGGQRVDGSVTVTKGPDGRLRRCDPNYWISPELHRGLAGVADQEFVKTLDAIEAVVANEAEKVTSGYPYAAR